MGVFTKIFAQSDKAEAGVRSNNSAVPNQPFSSMAEARLSENSLRDLLKL
jgi:hypothetical protein